MVESLLAEIQAQGNIDFLCPVSVASYSVSEEQVDLVLEDGRL